MLFQAFWKEKNLVVDVYGIDNTHDAFLVDDGGKFKWEPITEFTPLKKEEKEKYKFTLNEFFKRVYEPDALVEVYRNSTYILSGSFYPTYAFIKRNNPLYLDMPVVEILEKDYSGLKRIYVYCSEV